LVIDPLIVPSFISLKGKPIQGEDNVANPKAIINELIEKHGYEFKGAGPLECHLGCDFFCDPDGTLCFCPIKYIMRFSVFMKICLIKSQNLIHLY